MIYNKEYFKNILPKRPENSHKGTFGHVLNIAGSEFYRGAAYFSSVAPLKVGCGRVTLASEATALQAVASLNPDVILMPAKNLTKEISGKFQTISIGCGLSRGKNAIKTFKKVLKLLKNSQIPLVIDADGLNILSAIKNLSLPKNIILTPHPKEMSRLMKVTVETILENPQFWAKKCSEKYSCTTVLKLHKTIVADNKGNFYENNTGNSALAHGGSGDVLTGMISGFLSQGVNCFEASCLAVYLHGKTAEIASKDLTEYSVLASDLLNYIPKSIKTIL
ncbi:MAG: NAD(P)H-hydrate dehydratase [Candidatus Gastranaerophilaceae bacterium]